MIRIRYRQLGGHVHCRVFTGRGEGFAWAKAGDLVFDETAWTADVYTRLTAIAEVIRESETSAW